MAIQTPPRSFIVGEFFDLTLPISKGLCVRVTAFMARVVKSPDFSVEVMCSRYLFSRLGQLSSCRSKCPVDTCRHKKEPPTFVGGFVFALPIFTASHPATIVGVHVLNFCVRDGNRWTHMTINTNYVNGFYHLFSW